MSVARKKRELFSSARSSRSGGSNKSSEASIEYHCSSSTKVILGNYYLFLVKKFIANIIVLLIFCIDTSQRLRVFSGYKYWSLNQLLKFIYSEKATKSPNFIWNHWVVSKKVWRFSHIFLAFSEYMNFNYFLQKYPGFLTERKHSNHVLN